MATSGDIRWPPPGRNDGHQRGISWPPPGRNRWPLTHCPAGAKWLPAGAVARAADRALVEAPLLYPGLGAAVITQSALSPYAGVRGSEVKHQCGRRAFHRTVVVELLFPKELPSASLSQGVVFVSRFATGYRVWEVAH